MQKMAICREKVFKIAVFSIIGAKGTDIIFKF